MNRKVDHVLRQRQIRRHACHWPGCGEQVPPAKWGCRSHWFKLPKELRDEIWRSYRPGQELDRRPSRAYVEAARRVQDWIACHGLSPLTGATPSLFLVDDPAAPHRLVRIEPLPAWVSLPARNGEDSKAFASSYARYAHTGCPGVSFNDVCAHPHDCATRGVCRAIYEEDAEQRDARMAREIDQADVD